MTTTSAKLSALRDQVRKAEGGYAEGWAACAEAMAEWAANWDGDNKASGEVPTHILADVILHARALAGEPQ